MDALVPEVIDYIGENKLVMKKMASNSFLCFKGGIPL